MTDIAGEEAEMSGPTHKEAGPAKLRGSSVAAMTDPAPDSEGRRRIGLPELGDSGAGTGGITDRNAGMDQGTKSRVCALNRAVPERLWRFRDGDLTGSEDNAGQRAA